MPNLSKKKPSYRKSLLISLSIHLAVILALVVTLPKSNYRWHSNLNEQKPVVSAVALDANTLEKHIKQVRWEQDAQARAARKKLQQIEQRTLLMARRTRDENKHLLELKDKQKQLRQQHLAEEKAARQHLQKLQQEVKQLHRKALSAKQMQLQQQLLEKQMKKEQDIILKRKQELEKAQSLQLKGVLNKYRAQMLQTIQNNWHPTVQDAKLLCKMLIRLAPGGVVTKVDLLKGSGNAALDRSARLAVIKSSPLPVPKDPALFENFREVRITMSPQQIKGLQ